MLDKRPYKETQVEERVYRQYGPAASEHIIRNARAIQDKAKKVIVDFLVNEFQVSADHYWGR